MRENVTQLSLDEFMYYGKTVEEVNDCKLEWYNANCLHKKMICYYDKSLDDSNKPGSRLKVCDIGIYELLVTERRWWNVFTITSDKIIGRNGYWLCEAVKFKLDKNNNIICIAKPVKRINDDYMSDNIYYLSYNKQVGWWFIMKNSLEFWSIYKFSYPIDFTKFGMGLNFTELRNVMYKNKDISIEEMAKDVLNRYISESTDDILDKVAINLTCSSHYETDVICLADYITGYNDVSYNLYEYDKLYPLLVKKLWVSVTEINHVRAAYQVNSYLVRQIEAYNNFVNAGKIEDTVSQQDEAELTKAEIVLAYREYIKLYEKSKTKKSSKFKLEELMVSHPLLKVIK